MLTQFAHEVGVSVFFFNRARTESCGGGGGGCTMHIRVYSHILKVLNSCAETLQNLTPSSFNSCFIYLQLVYFLSELENFPQWCWDYRAKSQDFCNEVLSFLTLQIFTLASSHIFNHPSHWPFTIENLTMFLTLSLNLTGDFFMYFIQYCFICRPSGRRMLGSNPEVEVIKLNTAKIYRFLQLLSHSRGFFARV